MNTLRNTVIRVTAAAALFLPASALAVAQQAPQPASSAAEQHWRGGTHRHGFMGVLRGLHLSDQQKTEIRQIVEQYRQAHPERGADPQARAQMRDQVMNVLTPQQRSQVEQQLQHRRDEAGTSTPQP